MLEQAIAPFLARRLFGACAAGTVDASGPGTPEFFGTLDDAPLGPDALFDCASLTKSLVGAACALVALQEGRTSLDERIVDRLPELRVPWREEVTLRHLLAHTLDYRISLSSLKDLPPEEILARVLSHRFERRPGETHLYCNATSLVLGLWLERLERRRLDAVARERVFAPLGMESATYYPRERGGIEGIVPTEVDPWREGEVRGAVHDESAYALRGRGPVASAGLFLTVGDLQRFVFELLAASMGEGKLFSRETMELVDRNWIPGLGDAALGFERNQPAWMGDCSGGHRVGKTGFTGCSFVLDLKKRKGVVLLSNCTWPKRKPRAEIDALRRACAAVALDS